MHHCLPLSEFQSGFTTSTAISDHRIENVDLDDKQLGVHKSSSRTPHRLVTPPATSLPAPCELPSPAKAWEAFYPKGSINPKASIPGGFGFYLSGPTSFSDKLANGATEVIFSYRMMLQSGWEWAKGGKLPGVCESSCDCWNLS
jgi:hypothetical protein